MVRLVVVGLAQTAAASNPAFLVTDATTASQAALAPSVPVSLPLGTVSVLLAEVHHPAH